MKKQLILSLSLFSLLTVALLNCQKKEDPTPSTPTTPTNPVTATAPTLDNAANATTSSDITATSAKVSSTLSANGGAAISQHGHVWSETNAAPTIADTKTELGAASGPFPLKFTSELKSLKANTIYNVRAYATNDKGTAYGTAMQVKTVAAPGTATAFKSVTWSVHSTAFPKGGINDPSVLYLDGKIYTLGGGTPETSNHSTGSHPAVDDFWEYDIATKKWTQLPKMPFKGKDMEGSTIKYVYRNKIYAGDQRSGIYEYDLTTKQWTQKIKFTTSVDLPNCRIVLDDKLFAFTTLVGKQSKVIDLNTFQITDIPNLQTEAGSWSPTLATFLWNNRIHFWLKLRGQSTANTKLYTIVFDPKTNTYENLGTMTNLIPQVAAELEPTMAFEKDGFIYVYSSSFNSTFFLYNPTLKIMGPIRDNDRPSNFTYKPIASDRQGNMYQILGEAAAPIGFQLPLDDPKRYDKSVNHIRFQ